jgi:hypothetical protein
MYTFLHDFVTSCLDCQRCKREVHPNTTPIGSLKLSQPGTRYSIDYHGPFCESNGNKYILAIICTTSGWVELIATSDCKAETVIEALYNNIITRFGVPRGLSFQFDSANYFRSKLNRFFCNTFGVTQTFSVPYRPQANSKVELLATTLNQSLRILCKKQTDWSMHLQAVAWSIRASDNSLGLSPFEIMFGRKMELPIDVALTPEQMLSHTDEYIKYISPKIEIFNQLAEQNAGDNGYRQRIKINKNARIPDLKIGQKVLLYNPNTKVGETAKLKVRYTGPFLIV